MSGPSFPFLSKLKRIEPGGNTEGYLQKEMKQNLKSIEEAMKLIYNNASLLNFSRQFTMNGLLTLFVGIQGIDGAFVFPFDAEIIDVLVYNKGIGGSGINDYDVLISKDWNGYDFGPWQSLFRARPTVSTSAFAFSTFNVGSKVTGCFAPVLDPDRILVSKGDRIRFDLISAMTGSTDGSITVKYKKR